MIRDVDLVSYLPPFIAEFREINSTLTAENPEFKIVWEAADRVLKNEFIATADEYGISRFERILKIYPSTEDTLESRRARVQARWFASLPYTWRMLLEKLISICGENGFTISKDFLFYKINLEVNLDIFGQAEELERLIEVMTPCNMVFDAQNKFPCIAEGILAITGGVCAAEFFFITNDWRTDTVIQGAANIASGFVSAETQFITNDSQTLHTIQSAAQQAGGMVDSAIVVITNDFNENFTIQGADTIRSGTVAAETIEVKEN